MSYFEYIAIFQTTLVKSAPSKVIADTAKIEFFSNARSFQIPIQVSSILPEGANSPIGKSCSLTLPSGQKHLLITNRTKEGNPYLSKKYCEDDLDQTIASLSLLYGSGLFAKLIYRGWLFKENKGVMEAWIQLQKPFDIFEKNIKSELNSMFKHQNSDPNLNNRFKTMSRFFSKSLLVHPGEEKFLYLWTILEIFPMKNTSNIKPISDFLGAHMHKPPNLVKEKLDIGLLFGIRSNLVHDGELNVAMKEMGKVFKKLEEICIEVMRAISGINYSGSLDKYFR